MTTAASPRDGSSDSRRISADGGPPNDDRAGNEVQDGGPPNDDRAGDGIPDDITMVQIFLGDARTLQFLHELDHGDVVRNSISGTVIIGRAAVLNLVGGDTP